MKTTILLLLFSLQLFAAQSIMCSPEKTLIIKGISCCLERFSPEQCQDIIDNHLPPQIVEKVALIQKDINDGEMYVPGFLPNCHYNAVSFSLPELFPEAQILELYQYDPIIEQYYQATTLDQLQYGDLIQYYEFAQIRVLVDNGKVVKKIWVPHEAPIHSVVYLFDNIIFQKENANNDVFSIDTIEEVYNIYHFYQSSKPSMKKAASLETRFYQLIRP